MTRFLMVAAGGAAGAMARYALGLAAGRLAPSMAWPVGTFTANVLGGLLMGLLAGWLALKAGTGVDHERLRLLLGVGLLGGFTTFSAFGFETFQLANQGHLARAGLNILLTNAACLGAVWLGFRFVERFAGT